jgi:metal-responsive CopG/Arc/MetJ family transcriptional regulator
MGMTRVMVQLPKELKFQLDKLRDEGIGTSWFIRRAVEQALRSQKQRKGGLANGETARN